MVIGITEQSSALSGANVTDYHIGMVGDDGTSQTECNVYIQVNYIAAKLVSHFIKHYI